MADGDGAAASPATLPGMLDPSGRSVTGAVEAVTLDELMDLGRASLAPEVLQHLEGGAGAEITLRDNIRAFDRWRFRPAALTGNGKPDPSTTFLGASLAIPCLVAPFGTDTLFHADGHVGVARACAAVGAASIAPQFGGCPLEAVAAGGRGAVPFAQIYPLGGMDALRRQVNRAAVAGCTAMCVTVDFPTLGIRNEYRRRRWHPDIVHFIGSFPVAQRPYAVSLLAEMARIPERSWSWDDLDAAFGETSLPFFVKGVLTGHDARRAVGVGAKAVIVSNHGGRQLDGAPATLDQLGEVVEAVGGIVPVGLDGGIRCGRDIIVALARGASVVLVGRLVALALASAGQAGVRRALELLREEILTIMVLTGRSTISAIDETLLQPA